MLLVSDKSSWPEYYTTVSWGKTDNHLMLSVRYSSRKITCHTEMFLSHWTAIKCKYMPKIDVNQKFIKEFKIWIIFNLRKLTVSSSDKSIKRQWEQSICGACSSRDILSVENLKTIIKLDWRWSVFY